ncbi:MAG: hypothetical protein EXS63_01355 [Candidatus Omnitrophica bacterium]|nr:hypothetical protein [Candidatus Omnitrophota bacterium]
MTEINSKIQDTRSKKISIFNGQRSKHQVWSLKFLIFIFTWSLYLGSCNLSFAANEMDSCRTYSEGKRSRALHALYNLEDHYARMNWKMMKAWETRYEPLWDAEQMKKDPFSVERQAEGEVLSNRYAHLARVDEKLSKREAGKIVTEMKRLRTALEDGQRGCSSWAYQNCVRLTGEKILANLESLDILLEKIEKSRLEITRKIMESFLEAPSDHVPYGNRIYPSLQIWQVQYDPAAFQTIRNIREQLELGMAKADCCAQCTNQNLSVTQSAQKDPLGGNRSFRRGVPGGIFLEENVGTSFQALESKLKEKK